MNYNNSIAAALFARGSFARRRNDSIAADAATPRRGYTTRALAVWLAVSLATMPAFSAQTDISSQPLATVNTAAQAKPNIMLLMDTSTSIGWSHMPDELETVIGINSVGYKSAQCNTLYYNPQTTYALPKQASGLPRATPDFNFSPYNAYDTTSTTLVDLGSAFRAYDTTLYGYDPVINATRGTLRTTGYNDTAQAAYYYVHTGGNPIASYTSPACADTDTGATSAAIDGGTWTRKIVSINSGPGATDERANFAIWYTYYRTRLNLIKSAASLAFTPLTDSIRVGFITMAPKDAPADAAINPDKYLPIADFDSTQRGLWFAKLLAQKPGGSSPAREGLARVGRHYAGKQDGINAGMTGDPVQFSCQQNFTIMTTDGYWNDQGESTGLPASQVGGPANIAGNALVGQQDGNLNGFSTNTNLTLGISNSDVTPRPIWDGVASGNRTVTNKSNQFAYAACGVYFNTSTTVISQSASQTRMVTSQTTQSTVQNLQSTSQTLRSSQQTLKSTSQLTQSTAQNLKSTNQKLQSTHQVLQSTAQTTQSTLQNRQATNRNLQSTVQNLQQTSQTVDMRTWVEKTVQIARQSTVQNLETTTQNLKSTSQTKIATIQRLQSTVQNLQSTVRNLQSTAQTTKSTIQKLQSTVQNLQSTAQTTRSTSQTTQSTSQITGSSTQQLMSTAQLTLSTTQKRESTSQLRSCDAGTETCTPVPVGNCTPGGNITCETVTTGPTLVSNCTAASADPGNHYITTTCSTTATGPTAVASCTPASAGSSNAYTTTTCNTIATGPLAAQTCNPASASSGNAYTSTTCATNASGPTPTSACTPTGPTSANGWKTTTCGSNTTGPTGVASCTPISATSGNLYTATTCGTATTTNVPVASCSASGPSSGNSYTTTTCNPTTTTNVPVATCSGSSATSANNWTTTTCGTNNSSNVAVASCTATPGTSGNLWTTTSCPAPITTGPTGVQTCAPITAVSGNSYTATTCGTNNAANTPVASCSASSASSGNSWVTTTCPAPLTTTNVAVAACTASGANSGNTWTTTTCSNNNSTNIAVASCTVSAATSVNFYTTTSCPAPITTGPTVVKSTTCTAAAPVSGNNYTQTTCTPTTTTNVAVSSCAPLSETSGNSWTTTTCSTNNSSNVPVASCTPQTAALGNSWVTRTCGTNNTTNAAVASCTASGPTSGNGYTTTTCPAVTIVSGPTAVQTCAAVAPTSGNSYQETICTSRSSTVPSGTCTPQSPTSGNGWVTITCNTNVGGVTPVATCTAQTGNSGNGWNTITCPAPITTTNVAVLSCTAAAASSGNAWTTTTCPAPIVTGPTPVATCVASAATSGNGWTSTSCPAPVTTGPSAVQTCAPVAASSGNSWIATLCGSNNTTDVPVSSCTPVTAASGNGWSATTCRNNDTNNVAVANCTAAAAGSGNSWTQTTCPAALTTTNVAVASCSPDATPTSTNNYTTTTCTTNNSSNVPTGTCAASAATSGNGWVTTTCPVVSTGPTAVSTCAPVPVANAGNSWTTTTCSQNDTVNVAVSSCSPSGPTSGNGWTNTACNPNVTTDVPAATCSPSPATSANAWLTTTCSANNTTNVPVSSCTASAASSGNGWTTTTCPVVAGNVGVQAGTCTAAGPSSANNWTTIACPVTSSGPTAVASCSPVTPNSGNGWQAVTCSSVTSAATVVTTCNPAPPTSGNGYTATNCAPLSGRKIQYTMTTTITSTAVSNGSPVGVPTSSTTIDPAADLDGTCYGPVDPTPPLPTPNPQAAGVTVGPLPPAPCTTWPCTVTVNSNNPQSTNSLADVAQYYYVTDLRPAGTWPIDISRDDVPAVGSGAEDDRVRWQHMTTFTVALGVSGTLTYRPDYKSGSATTGDFADIRSGAKNWPLWPDPALDYANNKNNWNDPKSIDDFWHTAVNGRGSFFSAGDPTAVIDGIAAALAGISARVGSASGAGTSNLEPVPGDNFIYLAKYTTDKWVGEVEAHQINPMTAALDPTVIWSAQSLLDAKTGQSCDTRNIYLLRAGATNNLVNFSWNSRQCDGLGLPTGTADTGLNAAEQANFTGTNVTLFSQYPQMTNGSGATADQRGIAGGANLVNFLRGQRGLEGFVANNASKLYRTRDGVLGDTVNGQPTYVRTPFAAYGDPGYAAFKVAQGSRVPMLYVPANDGMLHAFYAGASALDPQGGKEAWAIVPSTVLPTLYKLADNNYKNLHQFSVDGTPTVSDIYDTSGTAAWKTVLVAGLNAGGKGYYAVDVTDPASPKGMWEFKWNPGVCPATPAAAAGNTSDCHLGLTFGKPLITKIADGTANGKWVVMVTSGYNNVNASATAGDGQGYLYVLDAANGQIIYKISTGVGDATTPSGLAQINNFVDQADIDNLTVRVYGTDVLGNIWRFDVNDNLLPAGREATLIGTAKDASNVAQPITTRPEVSEIGGRPMIFVGTGRMLGATDLPDTQVQSIYGIIDPLTSTTAFPNLRAALAPLTMTQAGSGAGAYRTVTCTGTSIQCNSTDGWYVNLRDAGERINVEMKLRSGTLIAGTNVPQTSICSPNGGYSWLNYFNFSSGLSVNTSPNLSVSEYTAASLIVGLTVVKLQDGTVKAIVTTSDASIHIGNPAFSQGNSTIKRVSWKEIAQ